MFIVHLTLQINWYEFKQQFADTTMVNIFMERHRTVIKNKKDLRKQENNIMQRHHRVSVQTGKYKQKQIIAGRVS